MFHLLAFSFGLLKNAASNHSLVGSETREGLGSDDIMNVEFGFVDLAI